MMARLATRLVDLKRVRARSSPVHNSEWLALLQELKERLLLSHPVRLAASPHVWAPSVFGIVYPTILLPFSMTSGIPVQQMRAILAHELAHIRRHDYLVNLVQQIVEALLFFNPAVWWINRQIRIEREACCDALALEAAGGCAAYAKALSDWIAENHSVNTFGNAVPAFGGEGKPGGVLDRLKRLLAPQYQPIVRVPWQSFLGVLLVSSAILFSAWRGSQFAVTVAAEWLTPAQRIEKIDTLQASHGEEPRREYTLKDRIVVAGIVRTEDGSPLPTDTLVSAEVKRPGSSFGFGGLVLKNGAFRRDLDYGKVYLSAAAKGWAPAFIGPLETFQGGAISGIEIILKKGFESGVKLVDNDGKPLSNVQMEGRYQHPSAWIGFNLVTDENGAARVEHAQAAPLLWKVSAPGFQYDERPDVVLKPGEVFVWKLQPAKATGGTVLDEATGKPVTGAKIKLVNRQPVFSRTWSPFSSAPVLATTDKNGRFLLTTLNDGARHVLLAEAPGFAPKLVYNLLAGANDIRISLGPELYVKGKIIGDLARLKNPEPRIFVTSPFEIENHSYRNSDPVPVDIKDGAGYFEIRGLRAGRLSIQAGEKLVELDVQSPVNELLINLDEKPAAIEQRQRQVILQFNTPPNLPPVKGELRVRSWTGGGASNQQSVPVRNGEVHFQTPVPGWIAFEPAGLVGYWTPEEVAMQIPAAPSPLIIERTALPAGAIYGEVTGADGSSTDQVLVSVVEVEKAPLKEQPAGLSNTGKSSAGSGDGPTKFMAQPLPLGGKYMIVAHRDNTFVASPVIELREKSPIQEIKLRLVKGVDLDGVVADAAGKSIEGIKVHLNFNTAYGHGFGFGDGVVTDGKGNFRFRGVNPAMPGSHNLEIKSQQGFRPMRQEIQPGRGSVKLVLHRGEILTGVVLNDSTGNPLSGVELYAIPDNRGQNEPAEFLDADEKTDAKGQFRFSSFEPRAYQLRSRSGEIRNGPRQGSILIQGGKTNLATLRLEPHRGAQVWELGKLVEKR